ncbi:hypothetical protein H6P81_017407 [Aristolochia fimbriata]|uniref:F-box domain-containing protein n=1 Tax=Aristolochia fimbriata TaxID=158543 RepID=A0AAV7DYX6_ARIFI|nr:hypothetical protein H6P81_017407 [Aristolochia fimbriata]
MVLERNIRSPVTTTVEYALDVDLPGVDTQGGKPRKYLLTLYPSDVMDRTTQESKHSSGTAKKPGECSEPSFKRAKSDYPQWEKLPQDIVRNILSRLDCIDLLVGAPFCCKSWYHLSLDASLWKEVDLSTDSALKLEKQHVQKMIEMVCKRSRGSMKKLIFPPAATDKEFLYVAERNPGLEYFTLNASAKEMYHMNFKVALSKLRNHQNGDIYLRKGTGHYYSHYNKLQLADAIDVMLLTPSDVEEMGKLIGSGKMRPADLTVISCNFMPYE